LGSLNNYRRGKNTSSYVCVIEYIQSSCSSLEIWISDGLRDVLIQNDSRNNILDERRERRGDARFANENAISQDTHTHTYIYIYIYIYIYMSKPTLHHHPRKMERKNNARQRGIGECLFFAKLSYYGSRWELEGRKLFWNLRAATSLEMIRFLMEIPCRKFQMRGFAAAFTRPKCIMSDFPRFSLPCRGDETSRYVKNVATGLIMSIAILGT